MSENHDWTLLILVKTLAATYCFMHKDPNFQQQKAFFFRLYLPISTNGQSTTKIHFCSLTILTLTKNLMFFFSFQTHAANENFVFAPLGINTLLAIFAEGSKGDTRNEIATALHFPEDVQVLRESYKALLSRYIVSSLHETCIGTPIGCGHYCSRSKI